MRGAFTRQTSAPSSVVCHRLAVLFVWLSSSRVRRAPFAVLLARAQLGAGTEVNKAGSWSPTSLQDGEGGSWPEEAPDSRAGARAGHSHTCHLSGQNRWY